MATTVARLEAILSANTADFESAMTRSESTMGKLGKVAGTAGLAIAAGVAYGLEKSVRAAMAAQTETVRLNAAFKAVGLGATHYGDAVAGAETKARRLGFTNEDVRNSLGSLIVATKNTKAAVSDLGVAQNLARFKQISLADASKTLTMAMAGSQRAAHQLGIIIPAVTTNYDKLKASGIDLKTHEGHLLEAHAKLLDKMATGNAVIAEVSARTRDQAKAFADTAAGGMAQFHAQLGNIEESIGAKLLPVMSNAIKWITTNWPAISAVIKQTYETDIKPTLMALVDLVKAVVDTIKKHWNTIGPIVTAVAQTIKDQLAIITGVITVFADLLRGNWSGAWTALKGVVDNVFKDIRDLVKAWLLILSDAMKGLGKAILTGLGDGISAGWKLVKDAVTGLFGKVIDWVKGALGISSPSSVFHEIGVQSIQGFINGVGSMAGVLEHAVVHMAEGALSKLNPFQGGTTLKPQKGNADAASNKQFALSQFARFGWGPTQFAALDALWNQESGWSQYAKNKSSGAYGIPQALPPTKMPYAAQEKGGSSPVAQILWGLNYIKGRYGSPNAAEAHELSAGWYDKGGWLPKGLSLALNTTGHPERVGGGGDTVHVHVGAEEVARVVFDQIRGKAQVFTRRNGRPAFGG